jgi:hypothetical protein
MEYFREQERSPAELRSLISPEGIRIRSNPNALRPTKVIEEVNPFLLDTRGSRSTTVSSDRMAKTLQPVNEPSSRVGAR